MIMVHTHAIGSTVYTCYSNYEKSRWSRVMSLEYDLSGEAILRFADEDLVSNLGLDIEPLNEYIMKVNGNVFELDYTEYNRKLFGLDGIDVFIFDSYELLKYQLKELSDSGRSD